MKDALIIIGIVLVLILLLRKPQGRTIIVGHPAQTGSAQNGGSITLPGGTTTSYGSSHDLDGTGLTLAV